MHDAPVESPRRPNHVVAVETIARGARGAADRLRRFVGEIAGANAVIPARPLEIIRLSTVGAKSGLIREAYLAAIPYQEGVALVAGPYGPAKRPAWFYNVKANPKVVVTFGNTSWRMTARLATTDECGEIWARGVETDRALLDSQLGGGDRDIEAFVLTRDEPTNSDPASEGQSWAEKIIQLNNAASRDRRVTKVARYHR